MKENYTPRQRKTAAIILIISLGLFLAYALSGFFTAFLGALIVYTLFRPMHKKLVEQKKWKPVRSTLLIIFISFIIIIVPLGFLIYEVADKIVQITGEREMLYKKLMEVLHQEPFNKWINVKNLQAQANQAGNIVLKFFSSTLNGLATGAGLIAVMYLILFFMLADYKKLENWLLNYLPFEREDSLLFGQEVQNAANTNIIGQGIISCVQGALVGIGFWIFGVPNPLLYGLIAIFASFIPVVGAAIIFVPGAIYAFVTGHTFNGFAILVWGFGIVATIDNVIRIFINKRIGDTHPLITFLGILFGIPFFGIIGLVIGPLLISIFILLIKIYIETYLKPKGKIEQELKESKEEGNALGLTT